MPSALRRVNAIGMDDIVTCVPGLLRGAGSLRPVLSTERSGGTAPRRK
jgi:hypothetical protein